jgi:membrane associated rhomboid family serine protease
MPRYPAPSPTTISFGPGPLSQAIKALIIANVMIFVAQAVIPGVTEGLGLRPASVTGGLAIWQVGTYMFLHAGVFHLLLNMLVLWMFGTELERIWGTRYFLKFYFSTGIGAGILTVLFSLLPFDFARAIHYAIVIGASGAIYGLLLAYGLYFPDRPILMMMLFPIPAKYFVMIIVAISLYSSLGMSGGVAHATHLGGLIIGYLQLRGPRGIRIDPLGELRYRYLRWKYNRARRRFDVYTGGRSDDRNTRVH